MRSAPVIAIEGALDTLDSLVHQTVPKFGGKVLSNNGDSYMLSFTEPAPALSAAEELEREWNRTPQIQRGACGIDLLVHRGTLYSFRSFLYGEALLIAGHVFARARRLLPDGEGSVFVIKAIRDALPAMPWHNRLHAKALQGSGDLDLDPVVYRLVDA